VGGAASAIGDVVKGEPIDWKGVAAGAAGGAVAGTIASATFGAGALAGGAAAKFGGMVAAGAAGGAVEQVGDNVLHEREWSEDVLEATATGAAVGAVAGGARALARPVARGVGNLLRKPVDPKWMGKLARGAGRRIARSGLGRRVGRYLARNPTVSRVGRAIGRPFGRAGKTYARWLERYPIRTKALTSGSISATGDAVAQAGDDKPYDWKRTAYRFGWGVAIGGPLGHGWFNFLGKRVVGNTVGAVGGRMALDQFVFAPAITTAWLGGYHMVARGASPAEAWSEIKETIPKTVATGWMFWVPGQGFVQSSVPLNARLPVSNAMGFAWSLILSNVAFKDEGGGDGDGDGDGDGAEDWDVGELEDDGPIADGDGLPLDLGAGQPATGLPAALVGGPVAQPRAGFFQSLGAGYGVDQAEAAEGPGMAQQVELVGAAKK